jgi:hypothetical protein
VGQCLFENGTALEVMSQGIFQRRLIDYRCFHCDSVNPPAI